MITGQETEGDTAGKREGTGPGGPVHNAHNVQ